MDENESIRRPRTDTVLRLSVRVDRLAQLASPIGCRPRNAVVRRVPERARRPKGRCERLPQHLLRLTLPADSSPDIAGVNTELFWRVVAKTEIARAPDRTDIYWTRRR
jgi:hypothetical protein